MRMFDKLVKRLEQLDWTHAAFERASGLAKNRIAKWGAGQGEPTARQALRMARLLAVPLEWLVDDSIDDGGAGLSPDELALLAEARRIGLEAARRRLGAVEPDPGPRTWRPGTTHGREVGAGSEGQTHREDVAADEPREPR